MACNDVAPGDQRFVFMRRVAAQGEGAVTQQTDRLKNA